MDPQACLMEAYEALNSGDRETCMDRLSDYWRWRYNGGCQPTMVAGPYSGDEFAHDMAEEMAAMTTDAE